MSSLVKLSISGIRSYDNRSRETLVFSKPLTLISGPNGVGKTTIIEALKYATTGDMPPNSRGGAFIHDPKMSGERQVLGQVKLGYYNARGQQMVVTRSMQLTMARKNATFKTLDGQLLIVADGVKETLSSRCADLDVQVPLSLGVSTAVLNYVIFCHQEDSLWPLSEPSLVKKRFDDIFEATKYSKALDAIKVLRKDYTSDIKLQEQTVEYLNQDNDRAMRISNKIDELTSRIQNLEYEADSAKAEMDVTVSQLDKLFKRNQNFQKIILELTQARHSAGELEEHILTISTDLEMMEDTAEEIECKLANFDNDERLLQTTASSLAESRSKLQASLQENQLSLESCTREIGKLETGKQNYDDKLVQLERLETELRDTYKVNIAKATSKEFLQQRVQSIEAAKSEMRLRFQQASREVQTKLDAKNAERATLQQKISGLEDSIAENSREIQELTEEIDKSAGSGNNGSIKYHETLLQELTEQLGEATTRINSNNAKNEIAEVSQNLAALRAKSEETNRDLIEASTRFNDNSRVMVEKDNLRKLRFRIDDLRERLAESVKTLGISRDEDPIVSLRNYKQELEDQEEDYTVQIQQYKVDMEQHKTTQDNLERENLELNHQWSDVEHKLHTAGMSLSGFEQSLKDVEEDLEIATQNLEQSSFTTQYYESAKAQASSTSKCILCHRDFAGNELESFLSLLTSKINSIPLTKEEATNVFEETRKEALALRALVKDFTTMTALDKKIPQTSRAIEECKTKRQMYSIGIDQTGKALKDCKAKIASCESSEKIIMDIEHNEKDALALESEIASLSAANTNTETPQQVNDRLQQVNHEIKQAEAKLRSLQSDFQLSKEKVADLQNAVSKKQLEIKNIELQDHAIKAKKARIAQLKAAIIQIEGSVPSLRSEVESVASECESLSDELAEIMQQGGEKTRELDGERSSVEKYLHKVSGIVEQINAFEAQGGSEKLAAVGADIEQIKTVLKEVENKVAEIDTKLAENERKIINSRGQKRILQDNLQLRTYRDQAAATAAKISELESLGAEADKDQFERETSELQQTLSELSSQHSLKIGQLRSLQEQKTGLVAELTNEYDQIKQKYLLASTKLDCTKNVTDDLGKYSQALDAAIMKYHSIKMEEINQVLDELWKDTYMGTDIDTILIKSEIEQTKTRANHNYRVVMYKQGVELDMRGRCSAGQKLLACVLIRLALSECFGLTSNFLVLDEPTTNLDVANIQSLGKSLSRIIESRRKRKNFQLIVITHDEHFLSCLGAGDFCDTFFRLHRDAYQHSKIEELPINQLG